MKRLGSLATLWSAVLIIAAIVAMAAWRIWLDYDNTLASSESLLTTLVRSGDEQLGGQLQSIDVLLHSFDSRLRTGVPKGEPPLLDDIGNQLQHVAGTRVVIVTDAAGQVRFATRPDIVGFDAAKRQYFTVPRDADGTDRMHLVGPIFTVDGRRMLYATMARRDAQGRFDGVVAVSLLPEFLAPIARSIRADVPGSTVVIAGADQAILYRLPDAEKFIGTSLRGAPGITAHLQQGERTSIHALVAVTDGIRRVTAFRNVQPYGLVVTVGIPQEEIFASFHRRNWAHAFILIFITALVLGLMIFLRRTETRLRLLSSVFEHSAEGTVITDADNRIVAIKESFVNNMNNHLALGLMR